MLRFRPLRYATAALLLLPAALIAQHHGHDDAGAASPEARPARAHLRLSSIRPATAADSTRAAEIERALLGYLARYADVRTAEVDGYVKFAPHVEAQPVFHYTHRGHAVRNAFSFDPARPTSLLYRRTDAGALELVGAMYTAPARASERALDARIPLSIAQWHQHVDICIPRGDPARWREQQDGKPRFGPVGAIVTREECAAARGRWLPRVFGWMVHANLERAAHGARISWEHTH